MTLIEIDPTPQRHADHACWLEARGDVMVRFSGRGPAGERAAVVAQIEGAELPLAWLRQVHSATVVAARRGACGEGDALVSEARALALSVATADCVPILLATATAIAAVHAGWRGIAQGIVAAAVAALPDAESGCTAWLGPAIGPCCYEVGDEVASAVVAASSEVARRGGRAKPHLDLHAAVAVQLERAGVAELRRLALCTRCAPETLWSYRRDGARAGRNLAWIWRR